MREVMRAVGARDLDRMFSFLADDAVVEMPFEARHGLARLDKAGFRQTMEVVLSMYDRFEIEFDRVYALGDVSGVVAEYRSDATLAGSGVPYRNQYCGLFVFRDGMISAWREYDNPLVIDEAMAAHASALTR
jgi:ketosteroid isomerase-like protein